MDLGDLEFCVIIPAGLAAFYFCWQHCTKGEIATRRQKWAWWLGIAISAAVLFGVGGLLSSYRIRNAARPRETGTINHLRSYSGSRSSGSDFDLLTDDHRTLSLRTEDAHEYLHNGDRVVLVYLTGWNDVLDLHNFSEPPQKWHHRTDDLGAARLSECVGAACAIAALALIIFRKNLYAEESDS